VHAVAFAPDGAVWFGTERGASRFDGKTWITYTVADGLASNMVRAIAFARDDAVWFATDGGISRYRPTR
jgi:ligand-binding sensor domain-containing protein